MHVKAGPDIRTGKENPGPRDAMLSEVLNITYKNHVSNEEVRNKIQSAIGKHDDLLSVVKSCKIRWYGHISRASGMDKTLLQGAEDRERGWKTT